jgi:hypothetical protein
VLQIALVFAVLPLLRFSQLLWVGDQEPLGTKNQPFFDADSWQQTCAQNHSTISPPSNF